MENKINVAELLKDCPEGMELDCTMYDNVTLDRVDIDDTYPIKIATKSGFSTGLTRYGQNIDIEDAKCVIFPKGKTTWEGFVPPCNFKDGDIVSIILGDSLWYGIYKKEHDQDLYCHVSYSTVTESLYHSDNNNLCSVNNITDIRLATEEEKDKLFQAIKDDSYKWNSETKTLDKLLKFKIGDKVKRRHTGETHIIDRINSNGYIFKNEGGVGFIFKDEWLYELVPNKFDITTLVPFESKVLVRYNKESKWCPAVWGFYDYEKGLPHRYAIVGGITFAYCIPYEGNKYLLGTTYDCDDFYKTWE